ncbi:YgaP family membrane protein [Halocatena pleomorpha]|uniref:DUF2892 domain-containing protein n=1 Tax=Halocatena pleomorpha TaxID=1785090 RepID=A0A3P3RIW0_9EURY|nr:DUF2892 domain-containing protein [Halocatena pleomorpha]RRJ33487.1 DUF2892 domain-containing protein [Halocatena pleomorpha]
MAFDRNVGGIDRIVRGVLGTWLLLVTIGAMLNGQRTKALAAGIASVGLLFNAAVGWCGLNAVLSVDRCQRWESNS